MRESGEVIDRHLRYSIGGVWVKHQLRVHDKACHQRKRHVHYSIGGVWVDDATPGSWPRTRVRVLQPISPKPSTDSCVFAHESWSTQTSLVRIWMRRLRPWALFGLSGHPAGKTMVSESSMST